MGNGEPDKACDASNQLVWFTTILAIIMTVLVLFAKSFLINTLFGQIDQDVFDTANIYLSYMAISILFIAIFNCGAAIFRTLGKSILPM